MRMFIMLRMPMRYVVTHSFPCLWENFTPRLFLLKLIDNLMSLFLFIYLNKQNIILKCYKCQHLCKHAFIHTYLCAYVCSTLVLLLLFLFTILIHLA